MAKGYDQKAAEVQPSGQPQDSRGDSHPDRDAQFASINVAVGAPRRPSGDLSQHQEKGRYQVECIEFHGEWNYTIPPKIRHFIFRQQTYPASHIYSQ
jgi:hypothetical protein